MTSANKILKDISDKKELALKLAAKFITLEKGGEMLGCKENKLIILTGQIDALERFYNNNFDSSGNNIDPIYVCPAPTLIKRYINSNFMPPEEEIIINGIDGNP